MAHLLNYYHCGLVVMESKEKNKELDALIRLIDEPNEEIFDTIRQRIFSYGASAISSLETAWENSFDPVIQHRIEDVIHKIQLENMKLELKNWSQFGYHDLLQGYLLVTRFQYPDLDPESIIKKVGQISQDVWLELNNNLTGLEKVKVINHILFDIHKFSGNTANISTPENYYVNHLLDTKKGTPLSLGIIYITIAQSLKMPVCGVDLPKHFVLAYVDEIEKEKIDVPIGDVLFYINPFNKGAVFTKNEIDLFIKQLKLEKKESYFKPCDNVTIIRRLINEMIFVYDQAGNQVKRDELTEVLDVL